MSDLEQRARELADSIGEHLGPQQHYPDDFRAAERLCLEALRAAYADGFAAGCRWEANRATPADLEAAARDIADPEVQAAIRARGSHAR